MSRLDPRVQLLINTVLASPDATAFSAALERAVSRAVSAGVAKGLDAADDFTQVARGLNNPRSGRAANQAAGELLTLLRSIAPTFRASVARGVSGQVRTPGVTDSPEAVREATAAEAVRNTKRTMKAIEAEDARATRRRAAEFNASRKRFLDSTNRIIGDLTNLLGSGLSPEQNTRYLRRIEQLRRQQLSVSSLTFDPANQRQRATIEARSTRATNYTRTAQYRNDVREQQQNLQQMQKAKDDIAIALSQARQAASTLRTTGGSSVDIGKLDEYISNLMVQQRQLSRTAFFDPKLLRVPQRPDLATPNQAIDDMQRRRTEDKSRQEENKYQKSISQAVDRITRARDAQITQLERILTLSRELDRVEQQRVVAARRAGAPVRQYNSNTPLVEAELNRVRGINPAEEAVIRGEDMQRAIARGFRGRAREEIAAAQARSSTPLSAAQRLDIIRDTQRRARDFTGGPAAYLGIDPRIDANIGNANPGVTAAALAERLRTATAETRRFEGAATQVQGQLRKTENAITTNATSWRKLGDQIGLATKRFGAFLIGSSPIFVALSLIRQGFDEALKIERAQTRLAQILGTSRGQVGGIVATAVGNAQTTGTAASASLSAIDVLAQAGIQDPRQLDKLTKLFSRVPLAATFGGLPETSEGLIAVNEIFGKSGDSLLPRGLEETEKLFDRLSRVSADYAVEVRDIFEAVRRGGSTFRETGGNLSEFIKLVTLVRSRSRESAESIGVFFKSLSFRLQRSSSRTVLSALNIDTGNGPYDTLRQLSDTFSQGVQGPDGSRTPLSEGQRVRIAESIAGVNQGGKFITLLQSLAEDRGKFERTVSSSGGSFTTETDKRLNDVATSLERIKQSVSEALFSIIDTTAIRDFASGLASAGGLVGKFASVLAGAIVPIALLTAAANRENITTMGRGIANRLYETPDRDAAIRAANAYAPERINPLTGRDSNLALRSELLNNSNERRVQEAFYRGTAGNQLAFTSGVLNRLPDNLSVNATNLALQEQTRQRDLYLANQARRNNTPLARANRFLGRGLTNNRAIVGILATQGIGYVAGQRVREAEDSIQSDGVSQQNLQLRRNARLLSGLMDSASYALTVGLINPVAGLAVGIAAVTKDIYNYSKQIAEDTRLLDEANRIRGLSKFSGREDDLRANLETLGGTDLKTVKSVLDSALTKDLRGGRAINSSLILNAGKRDLGADFFSSDNLQETILPAIRSYFKYATAGTSAAILRFTDPNGDTLRGNGGKVLSQDKLSSFVNVQSQLIEFNDASSGKRFERQRRALLDRLTNEDNAVETALRDYQISIGSFFGDVEKVVSDSSEGFALAREKVSGGRLRLTQTTEGVGNLLKGGLGPADFITGRLSAVRESVATIRKTFGSQSGTFLDQLTKTGELVPNIDINRSPTEGQDAAKRDIITQAKTLQTELQKISSLTGTSYEKLSQTLTTEGATGVGKLAESRLKPFLDKLASVFRDYIGIFETVESNIEASANAIQSRRQEIDSLSSRSSGIQNQLQLRALQPFGTTNRMGVAQALLSSVQSSGFDGSLVSAASSLSNARNAARQAINNPLYSANPSQYADTQAAAQRKVTEANITYSSSIYNANRAIELLSENLTKTSQALEEYKSQLEINKGTIGGFGEFSKSDVRKFKRNNVTGNITGLVDALNTAQTRSGLPIDQIAAAGNSTDFNRKLKGMTASQREQAIKFLKSLPGGADIGKMLGRGSISADQLLTGISASSGTANIKDLYGDRGLSYVVAQQKDLYSKITQTMDQEKSVLEQQLQIIKEMRQAQELLLSSDIGDNNLARDGRFTIDREMQTAIENLNSTMGPLRQATEKFAESINKSLGSIVLQVDPIKVEISYNDAVGVQNLLKIENDKLRTQIERVFKEQLYVNVDLQKDERPASTQTDTSPRPGGGLE